MHAFNDLTRAYYLLRSALNVPYTDIRLRNRLGLPRKLYMWYRGFLSDKYYYYDLANNNPGNYLSDRDRALTRFINEPFTEILNNKIIFEKVLSHYTRVPKNLGLVIKGRLHNLKDDYFDWANRENITKWINALLDQYTKVVLKPIMGAFGDGVYIISRLDDGRFLVNLDIYGQDKLNHLLSCQKQSLICEYIYQSLHPRLLFPESTNTMRILTLISVDTGQPFIAAAVRRVGSSESAPMDNCSKGGLSININLNTGQMGAAAQIKQNGLVWHSNHPDTGAKIKGAIVPSWEIIKVEVLKVANQVNYLKAVGWDVVETDNGLTFIEGNSHANARVLQIHTPL